MKLQPINRWIVATFILMLLIITSLFTVQALQPLNKAGLKSDLKILRSLVTETQLILRYSHQSTNQYTQSHLQDIAQKADEIRKDLQNQKYSSEISPLKAVSSSISAITASDLETFFDSNLEKDKQTINRLIQKL